MESLPEGRQRGAGIVYLETIGGLIMLVLLVSSRYGNKWYLIDRSTYNPHLSFSQLHRRIQDSSLKIHFRACTPSFPPCQEACGLFFLFFCFFWFFCGFGCFCFVLFFVVVVVVGFF